MHLTHAKYTSGVHQLTVAPPQPDASGPSACVAVDTAAERDEPFAYLPDVQGSAQHGKCKPVPPPVRHAQAAFSRVVAHAVKFANAKHALQLALPSTDETHSQEDLIDLGSEGSAEEAGACV